MSSNNKIAQKLSDLKKKSTKLEVVEIKEPIVCTDLLSQFKSATGGTTDAANEYIIDVFPNFIPIIMYVMMLANRAASACDYKTHAKASPPTIIWYYCTILYGYFLVNDAFVRPVPSIHARNWKLETMRHEFLKFIMTLPVPDDLLPILAQFAPTTTERTGNVFIIPSFAGFDHHLFFGRYFPLKFFLDLHNTVAAVPGNSPPYAVYNHLYKRAIAFTIPNWTFGLADILGIQAKTTTGLFTAPTRLNQVFDSIFNPVLFRDFHRRSSLARIPVEVPDFDSSNYNAYDAIFGFTETNASEYEVVLRSLATILSGTVPMKKSLSEVVSESSGIEILRHGYSEYALPTWSYNLTSKVKLDKDTEAESLSAKAFASSIHFLQKDSLPDATQAAPSLKVEKNDGTDASATHRVTKDQRPYNRLYHKEFTTPSPSDTDLILFSPSDHIAPRVRVLDVDASGTINAYTATLCGKVIESFELDGHTISVPNTNIALGLENSSFADSALAFPLIVRASSFDHDATSGPAPPQKRHFNRDDVEFSASALLFDRTTIRLPVINPTVRDTAPAIPTELPGFLTYYTNWFRGATSFIGLKTIPSDAAKTVHDDLKQVEKNSVYAWSPYTFTSRTGSYQGKDFTKDNRIYFLMNMRTLFGSDYNLVEVNGAYHAMPCS